MYTAAISGAESITERGRSRSGERHSPANTQAESNPDRAPIDVLVNTFNVKMENAGRARENGAWAKGTPLIQRFASRYSITTPTATVRIDPLPVIHLPKRSPRTLTAKTTSRNA